MKDKLDAAAVLSELEAVYNEESRGYACAKAFRRMNEALAYQEGIEVTGTILHNIGFLPGTDYEIRSRKDTEKDKVFSWKELKAIRKNDEKTD